jgi:hypothetical protein
MGTPLKTHILSGFAMWGIDMPSELSRSPVEARHAARPFILPSGRMWIETAISMIAVETVNFHPSFGKDVD